jgi:hypothetical protein
MYARGLQALNEFNIPESIKAFEAIKPATEETEKAVMNNIAVLATYEGIMCHGDVV